MKILTDNSAIRLEQHETLLAKLVAFFIPKNLDKNNVEDFRKARILIVMSIILACVSLLNTVFYSFIYGLSTHILLALLFILNSLFACMLFRSTQKLKLASNSLIIGMQIILFTLSLIEGGIRSSFAPTFVVAPQIAVLLTDKRNASFHAILVLLLLWFLYFIDSQGIILTYEVIPTWKYLLDNLIYISLLISCFGLSLTFEHGRLQSYLALVLEKNSSSE